MSRQRPAGKGREKGREKGCCDACLEDFHGPALLEHNKAELRICPRLPRTQSGHPKTTFLIFGVHQSYRGIDVSLGNADARTSAAPAKSNVSKTLSNP